MAKRVPPDDKPYRPVDDALVQSVLNPKPLAVEEESESSSPAEAADSAAPAQTNILNFPAKSPEEEKKKSSRQKLSDKLHAVEKLEREKRFLLSPTEDRELERLVSDMARELGTTLKTSHLMRAIVAILRNADQELIKQSRRVGPLKRPANGDATALAVFEHYLAQLIESGIKNAKSLQ